MNNKSISRSHPPEAGKMLLFNTTWKVSRRPTITNYIHPHSCFIAATSSWTNALLIQSMEDQNTQDNLPLLAIKRASFAFVSVLN